MKQGIKIIKLNLFASFNRILPVKHRCDRIRKELANILSILVPISHVSCFLSFVSFLTEIIMPLFKNAYFLLHIFIEYLQIKNLTGKYSNY